MIVLSKIETDVGFEFPEGYTIDQYVGGVYVQYNYMNKTIED